MLQVDMVGYRKEGEPMQLARPDIIGLAEAGYLVGNLSEMCVLALFPLPSRRQVNSSYTDHLFIGDSHSYAPELVTGYTPACCSDHQSFVTSSYPSSWIFERNGAIADPCAPSSPFSPSCFPFNRFLLSLSLRSFTNPLLFSTPTAATTTRATSQTVQGTLTSKSPHMRRSLFRSS